MTNFPNGIGHDDHGIGPELIEWLQNHETIAASEPDASGITKVVLEIPAELRGAMCALHGPSVGDDAVDESEVHYAARGNRKTSSRLCLRAERPAKNICIIGLLGNVAFTAYGTNSDTPAPQEPDDPHIRPEDVPYAKRFWAEHALSA